MSVDLPRGTVHRLGRLYFAFQASAGALWWVSVFTVDPVREATLGGLDPMIAGVLDIPLFVLASALAALGLRWAVWTVVVWTALVAVGMAGYATLTGLAGWGALLMAAATLGGVTAAMLVLAGRLPSERMLIGPFAFRTAARTTTTGYMRKTALQILVLWGLALVVVPLAIAWFEDRWGLGIETPVWVLGAGIALLITASGLGLSAAAAVATTGEGTPLPSVMPAKLVVSGPYRFVRNPMAISGVAQGAAVGLMLGSWLVVLYALGGSLVWNWLIRPHEERDLEIRFGDGFRRYRSRVPCWLPRLRPVPKTV